jgi:hypothetical protein
MKAPAEPGRGSHAHQTLTHLSGPDQASFEEYRAGLTTTAVYHGTHAARVSDPDGFQGAVEAILEASRRRDTFTADDVVWSIRGPELGSAFRTLAQAGEIVAVGFTTSKRPRSHGRILRIWRAA